MWMTSWTSWHARWKLISSHQKSSKISRSKNVCFPVVGSAEKSQKSSVTSSRVEFFWREKWHEIHANVSETACDTSTTTGGLRYECSLGSKSARCEMMWSWSKVTYSTIWTVWILLGIHNSFQVYHGLNPHKIWSLKMLKATRKMWRLAQCQEHEC